MARFLKETGCPFGSKFISTLEGAMIHLDWDQHAIWVCLSCPLGPRGHHIWGDPYDQLMDKGKG